MEPEWYENEGSFVLDMIKVFAAIVVAVCLGTGLGYVMVYVGNWIINIPPPIMQVTYPNGTCVEIIPPEAGTCTAPPHRFDIEWVSPVREGVR